MTRATKLAGSTRTVRCKRVRLFRQCRNCKEVITAQAARTAPARAKFRRGQPQMDTDEHRWSRPDGGLLSVFSWRRAGGTVFAVERLGSTPFLSVSICVHLWSPAVRAAKCESHSFAPHTAMRNTPMAGR